MIKTRIAIVAVGVVLPYAARLPGALTSGPDWLWSYFGDGLGAVLFFGAFNAICWGAILAASYTYRNPHAVWFPAVLGFVFSAFMHVSLDLSADAQAAIALALIPILSLPLVFVGWLVGRWFDRRKVVGGPDAGGATRRCSGRG